MSPFHLDTTASAALWVVVKVSVLLGVAAAVQAVLRGRGSAATRHFVWTLAIVSVLMLPLAFIVMPEWAVVVRTAPRTMEPAPLVVSLTEAPVEPAAPATASTVGTAQSPATPRTPDLSWVPLLVGVYVAGVIVMVMYLALQHWMVRRSVCRATVVRDAEWMHMLADCAGRLGLDRPVSLILSREHTVPSAIGIRRSSIMLPMTAETWTHDRRRAVVLHEMAHVARLDCLTQTLACAACALYWFHPAVWWVARQLRVERELACDDRVIGAGTRPREYAGHLLEIAYSLGGRRTPALAVSMARPRELEGRMLAALDDRRNRHVPAPRFRFASATTAAMLLFPLATIAPTVAPGAPDSRPAASMISERYPLRAPDIGEPESVAAVPRRVVDTVAPATGAVQEASPGTWELRPTDTEGIVHLRLVERQSSSGTNIPIEKLEGLTGAQLAGPGGPIEFRLKRDAGTFSFAGVVREGVAAGTFSFTADPAFPAELEKRGFARPTSREQYQMARHDIGYAFLDELNAQGYAKPETSELVRAGQHGVQVAYLREMGTLGYRLGSLEPLITLRDHGVTPAYVRALQAAGYKNLTAEELRRARDHGVTAEYVGAMRDAGYGSLPMDDLIRARDHGVTGEYLRAMHDAGYGSLPLDEVIRARDHGVSKDYLEGMRDAGYGSLALNDLVNARDHGVTPAFVRQLGEAGYQKLPIEQVIRARDHGLSAEFVRGMGQLGHAGSLEELVRARDHGVGVDFVRGLAGLGYDKLSMDELVRLRDHGVTAEYAREIKALGYDNLTPDDLVTLRDYGLTPEKIRDANTRAGTRLPVDLLKSLARRGM